MSHTTRTLPHGLPHAQHAAPPSRVLAPKRHSRTTDCLSTSWVPAPTKHHLTIHGLHILTSTPRALLHIRVAPPTAPCLVGTRTYKTPTPPSRVATHTSPPSRVLAPIKHRPHPHGLPYAQHSAPPSRVAPRTTPSPSRVAPHTTLRPTITGCPYTTPSPSRVPTTTTIRPTTRGSGWKTMPESAHRNGQKKGGKREQRK